MIGALLRETIVEPRGAARRLMAMRLDLRTVWMAFALVMVLGTALGLLMRMVFPVPRELLDQMPLLRLQDQPLIAGAVQSVFLIAIAWAMAAIGRRFGGDGRFDQTLLLVSWMEFTLMMVQVVQIFATLLFPPVATLIGFAGFGVFFMLLTVFSAEANGFTSLPLVFLGVLASLLLAALVAAVFFVFFGLMPIPEVGN
jgi:hypothetical protein